MENEVLEVTEVQTDIDIGITGANQDMLSSLIEVNNNLTAQKELAEQYYSYSLVISTMLLVCFLLFMFVFGYRAGGGR